MLSSPDVLGMVLTEGLDYLEKSNVAYTIKEIPPRVEEEQKTGRIIRQCTTQNGTVTELLIAYF